MQYEGNSYGTVMLNSDGTAAKTADNGSMESEGTLSITDGKIILLYPDEGDATEGTFKTVDEDKIVFDFMGIEWT